MLDFQSRLFFRRSYRQRHVLHRSISYELELQQYGHLHVY